MKQFEYEITTHLAETFTHVTYFCNEEGDCAIHQVPEEQVRLLTGILNDRGRQGWELMQLAFGKGGLMAFWKRGIKANTRSKTKKKA
jgi:hypothetical protein